MSIRRRWCLRDRGVLSIKRLYLTQTPPRTGAESNNTENYVSPVSYITFLDGLEPSRKVILFLAELVVGWLIGDNNIVRMAFDETGVGDAYQAGFVPQFL